MLGAQERVRLGAVRLAGGSALEIATASKPNGYEV